MNIISKKLHELEKNVLPEQPLKETSRWGFDNGDKELNKAEQQLYDIAKNIGESVVAEDMTPDQHEIIIRAHRFVAFRILDLFEMWAKSVICYNDPLMWHIFTLRFYWFLNDVSKQIEQQYEEQQIRDEPGFFDLCPGEQDKRLKPLYDKWERNLFTKDSFMQFCDRHLKTLPEFTPEQIAEMEKLDQEEKDVKRLTEKRPSCHEKCKWFHSHGESAK